MKRGDSTFTHQKEGWERCNRKGGLKQTEEQFGKRGWARGSFVFQRAQHGHPCFLEMRNLDEGPTDEGWSIWHGCLYQCGDFRGVLAETAIFEPDDENQPKMLLVLIENPNFVPKREEG